MDRRQRHSNATPTNGGGVMIYSYTQLAHFMSCPRRYRYRYLDGWVEKDLHASALFGRAFEVALAAYYRGQDAEVALYNEWARWRERAVEYPRGESWDRMLHEGVVLLQRFSQEARVHVEECSAHLQVKISRQLSGRDEFVGYIDAIGMLDGRMCVIDWKTTSSSYPQEPDGILALDPQLICYSWLTGLPEVALVVFVRKRNPEIQYLSATITDEQRSEFGQLVDS